MTFESLVMLMLALFAYFLPVAIAQSRHHDAVYSIFGINLVLGWTVLGWFIALIWAFTTPHPESARTQVPAPPPARTDDDGQERIPCPFCAERILPAAKVCKHCHATLSPPALPPS
ncbi:MAG: superinfection immunity protein [Anaerolineae bacterium]